MTFFVNEQTDLDEVVEESGIERFGERVSSVDRLLRVERHLHALLAFPHATDELRVKRLRVDAQKVRRKVQICNMDSHRIQDRLLINVGYLKIEYWKISAV